jgi:hypothetical protein
MNTQIEDLIRKKYNRIIFNPIKLPNYGKSNAIGFVVTDSKLVIGFVKKDGTLCKLLNPIDLGTLTNENLIDILKKIPIVSGFTEIDKQNLLKLFEHTSVLYTKDKELTRILKEYLNDPTKNEYIIKYNDLSQNFLLIKKEKEELFLQLQEKLNEQQNCNKKVLGEKQIIISKINEYKNNVTRFLNDKSMDIKEIKQKFILVRENLNRDQEIIKRVMENMSIQDPELKNNILDISNELKNLNEELNSKKMEIEVLKQYKNNCGQKIIQDKEQIIQAIKNYKEQWMNWLNNTNTERKILINQLKKDYTIVNQKFQEILKENYLKDSEIRKLKDSLMTLQSTIDSTTSDQLIAINAKHAEEIENYKKEIERQRQEITQLNNDLNAVRELLQKNIETKIPIVTDYSDCKKVAYVFRKVNNQIMRKKEVIQLLKNKILPKYRNIASQYLSFEELAPNIIPNSILDQLEQEINNIEQRLNTHISFFDLEKYNIESKINTLENPAIKATPDLDEFCQRLNDINFYWSQNEKEFLQDDIQLTNIYEDLSGAVRVYVKIRPNEENTIRVIEPNNPRSLEVDCPSPQDRQIFSNFYGVFDQTFTNKEIFTGFKDDQINMGFEQLQIPNLDTSPGNIGLYNSFRQVENGYSIIIFGYGLSGSGKTRTLFGNTKENEPGLIHYALSNLDNVQSISIKNIFEHYSSKQNVQEGYLSGQIINLLGKIPPIYTGQNTYNVPQVFEEQELTKYNLQKYKNISLPQLAEQLERITNIIEKHRIKKGRIKETPNNPSSSRSHLFIVFKIYFTSGKTGYLTFVDMAGRESPVDIYETYLDPGKYSLATFMLNARASKQIPILQQLIYPKYANNFDISYIYNMLEEGFFINENINHLTYFFQQKNNKKTDVKKQLKGIDSYSPSRFFVSPSDEQKGNINTSKNCLMIPILQYLDNQGKSATEFKPTKFIMICNVRQESRYCKQIVETLNFANNVKST